MRSFLAVVAAVAALLLVWLWPSAEGTSVESLPVWGATPVEADETASSEDLVSVPSAVGRAAPEAPKRVAVSPELTTVARPKGFSELVVRVRAASQPVVGAIVEISEDVDAVLNGVPDDEGRSVTGDDGTVRFFVRPTRTAVIRATDDEASRTSEGTFTTPFEGRNRTVELDIGLARGIGTLPFQVVTELGRTPLPGATVRVDGPGLPAAIELTTDGDGEVSTTEGGRLTYSFACPGFVPRTLSGASLDEESDRPISVVLRPYSTVRGRIDGAYDGPQPITREEFERRNLHPMDIKPTRRVMLKMKGSSFERGFRVATMIGADGSTFTSASGSHTAFVSPDGTWSARVAIEDGESEWREVGVELLLPDQTRRILGVIDRLRPGDDIVVPDPWSGGKPLDLAVQDAAGEPVAAGRRIYLSRVSVDAARTDAAISGQVDGEGRVRFAQVPRGSWNYFIKVDGAPPSWSYSGSFEHRGSSEPVVLLQAALPLTVRLTKGGDTSERRQRPVYMVGIAKAGAAPQSTASIRQGRSVSFPRVPSETGWEVVLVEASRIAVLAAQSPESVSWEELHRVPIGPGAGEIVLELK
jgi:hypothetical protein